MRSETHASFVARIKTSRLDNFTDSLKQYGKVRNLTKEGTDISLSYEDKSEQITALEEERARLVELYENASMQEIIQINSRISTIDMQLRNLNNSISQYDSLIEYSRVTLEFYGTPAPVEEKTFGGKIKEAFLDGWDAMLAILEFFSLAFVTLLPFLAVALPVGIGIYFLVRLSNKRKRRPLP